VLATILILPFGAVARPQAAPVHVKVRAILVDKDLNQKAVPFLAVKVRNAATGAEVEVKTGLDGAAQVELAEGKYFFSTAKAIEFGGKKYSWSVAAAVKSAGGGGEQEVLLTNDNAKVEAGTPEVSNASGNAPGELTALFEKLKGSIFTVRSEFGMGSGFLVDASGLVVTNHHVVGKSNYLALQFDKSRKVPAKLLADSADKDIAVLWVNPAAFPEAHVAPLAPMEGTHIEVGQRVFTIGNPFGLAGTLTSGLVSSIRQVQEPDGVTIDEAIQTDAAINPGNSGGPLLNSHGEVIGINTMIASSVGQNAGIGFAIPINTAKAVLNDLLTLGRVRRPALGVVTLPVSPDIAEELGLADLRCESGARVCLRRSVVQHLASSSRVEPHRLRAVTLALEKTSRRFSHHASRHHHASDRIAYRSNLGN
jgi:S1-C subfamily serine protease